MGGESHSTACHNLFLSSPFSLSPPQCKLSVSEVTHIKCGLSVKTITLPYFHPACLTLTLMYDLSHLQELYDPWKCLLTLVLPSKYRLTYHLAHAPDPSKVCHRKQHYLSQRKLEQTIQPRFPLTLATVPRSW